MKFKKILTYIFVAIFAVTISACSDSGSDSGGDDAPSPPDLTAKAQPDISFFQNNNPNRKAVSSVNNFNTGKIVVLSNTVTLGIGQIYNAYLAGTAQNKADYKNGKYIWTYDFAQGGVSISIKTTAEEQTNGYKWSVFVSGDDGEGNTYNDVKLFGGSTSDDGAQGDWSFFNVDPSNPYKALTSSWNVISATNKTVNLTLFHEDGSTDLEIDYQEDNAEYTTTFIEQGSPVAEVYWNTNSNVGYYSSDGDQLCWDGSFQDVSCSSVGL